MRTIKLLFFKAYLVFLLPIVIFSSCRNTRDEIETVEKDFEVIHSDLLLNNPDVISFVNEYIEANENGSARVYTLTVSRNSKSITSLKICSINTYSELNSLIPSAYFFVKNDIILIYTGLETFAKRDEAFIKKLKYDIGDKIQDDLLDDGETRNQDFKYSLYDPTTWEMKMMGDSISINRDVINPLGPPIKELKFVMPTAK